MQEEENKKSLLFWSCFFVGLNYIYHKKGAFFMLFRRKSLKYFALLLLLFSVSILALGCGGGAEQKAEEAAKDEQVLVYNMGTEPESLDPAKITGIPEGTVVYGLFDGLTRNTSEGLKPAIAEKWEVSEDGLKYVFYLRDAKWTNGDPVTAHDFEYAWKRALNPETGCKYAYQLYYIKNGKAYNEGKITDPDQVGVKAIDDKTLEVTLEAPAPYFLYLTSFYTLFPVHKATVEANPDWANSPETYVSNGPFKLAEWKHHDRIVQVKNEDYWDKDNVKLDKIVLTMIEEASTYLTMWENGELDAISSPPLADMERLMKEGKVQTHPYLGTYYYILHTEKEPFDDPRVRRALGLAIDRKMLTEHVTKGGQIPALAFVPSGIPDADGGDFRENGGEYIKDADYETARKLLEEAGYPNGEGLPEITILYNTSEAHKAIAEAIQEMWKTNLGIENVKLTNQEWKVYLNSRKEGDFHIARAGWIGDYLDPMTFLNMFVTDSEMNDGRWSNARYDELIALAKSTGDQKVRMEAMHEAEKILMEEMPIIPIYYYVQNVCVHDYVKGIFWDPLGPPQFKNAWIDKQ